ncbi:hypothetical protein ABZ832_02685 [Streptantibioticus parmotrematis]|uniref:hypothetical protein n=1 Tax=Streptantibioticus parmotrematis TaxID=2873249 RepID=UPI0033DE97F1
MNVSAFLYPWDVVGDPDAPRRLADLGIGRVTLASAYHSTRALTPRHPHRRMVTAAHSAVLYPPSPEHWRDAPLRPRAQRWLECADPWGEAAAMLADAGIEASTWVVLTHNSLLGGEHPRAAVRNAYGDPYPWALCVARPEVLRYAVALAAEAGARPGARGAELEACGWFGVEHAHAHDKTAGVPLGGAARYLMSLCFCGSCRHGYAELGADPDELRDAVRAALGPVWSGERGPGPGPDDREGEWAEVVALLGSGFAELTLAWRARAARAFQRATVAAVRERAGRPDFPVLLHADPAPHRSGSNAGVDAADVLTHADGVVLPCTGPEAVREDVLRPFRTAVEGGRRDGDEPVIAANLTVVSGMGGSPGTLADDAAHAVALGAGQLRLYHAGVAADADLALAARELARLRA